MNGLLVLKVKKPSGAAERGLQPGDVLTAINQTPLGTVKDAQQIVEAAKSADRKFVLLLINRRGDTRFVPLPITSEKK